MESLYKLLRMAVSPGCAPQIFDCKLSGSEWDKLHSLCLNHLVVAVAYRAICRLPKEQRPPMGLLFQWASEAETVKGHNQLLNAEAARLTELFSAKGRKSAVLKGAANARLYPDPFMRHAGDIDLWVEGGKKSVTDLVREMDFELDEKEQSSHHIHLLNAAKVAVEIHYKPSSGPLNPFANARLQRYLEREILNTERVPEGFSVPSIKFALVMQMSHLQRHFIGGGIGLKQFVDYFILLQHSTAEDRREVASRLSRFGLKHMSGAIMWILGEVLGLEPDKMLVAPDAKLGKKMLAMVYEGGNFGYTLVDVKGERCMNFIVRWLLNRWKTIRLTPFSPTEVFWHEVDYWKTFAKMIPYRIKHRRLSIWELYH